MHIFMFMGTIIGDSEKNYYRRLAGILKEGRTIKEIQEGEGENMDIYQWAEQNQLDSMVADAISYYFFGNKDDDNPFHTGFYRSGDTHLRDSENPVPGWWSEFLFDEENLIPHVFHKEEDGTIYFDPDYSMISNDNIDSFISGANELAHKSYDVMQKEDQESDEYIHESETSNIDEDYINDALQSYLETAIWADLDGEEDKGGFDLDDLKIAAKTGKKYDEYSIEDVSGESWASSKQDIEKFIGLAKSYIDLGIPAKKLGHDFWLTRYGHGAGFWDGDYDEYGDEVGDKLTELTKQFPQKWIYVGDDGKVYID